MADRPDINASPLIYLARAGLIDLLRVAGPAVAVPSVVAGETRGRGPSDPTVKALADTPWLEEVEAPFPPLEVLAWGS